MSSSKSRVRLIGSRAFYLMVLAVVVPIIVQNAISSFVNLLDNIMVGKVGTNQMTGVSIANQLLFVSNLCVFGGMSGAGIFAAQFHGARDAEGVRHCFRYKLWLCVILTLVSLLVFLCFGENLLRLFMNEENAEARIAETMDYAWSYLRIMLVGIPPFVLSQAYASTLRETGDTKLPMAAGIIAVCVNLVFNWLLIYDHGGFKGLGVQGAAVATVLSRFVELAIIGVTVHRNVSRYPFIQRTYRSLKIPMELAKRVTIKGMPLLLNEGLWSLGMTMLAQTYSLRGLDVVAAMNISNTISNLFSIVFLSMGNATAIIIGQLLGANDQETAVDHAWKLTAFSLMLSTGTALVVVAVAPFVPMLYNTSEEIRALATRLLWVYAVCMPLYSFCNSCYFTLRSGGKTMITFVFDSGFVWVISLPLATVIIRLTGMDIVPAYLIVQLADAIKCAAGFILMKKGVWVNNMVAGAEDAHAS